MPHACPEYGGPLDETHVAQQFQVEIPRRPIHRPAQHLWNHRNELLTFLRQPGLDATTWRAELAMTLSPSPSRS